MRLFRSKVSDDRKGSLDSNFSSVYSNDSIEDAKRRKSSIGKLLKKKHNSADIPRSQVTTIPTHAKAESVRDSIFASRESNKLKKQQRNDFPTVDISQAYKRDKQTGEQVIDHTDMLHSLVHQESSDSIPRLAQFNVNDSGPVQNGEDILAKLPAKVWISMFEMLSPADKVSLSFTCRAFRRHLISSEAELELPENKNERIDFLLRLDSALPEHLFCFACNVYHPRINPRKESLRPTNVANPVFTCPHAQNVDKRIPRIRLTSGRTIPFTFVQLAVRAHLYSLSHGITLDSLSRRWRDRENTWSHQTRYAIVNSHLLMRVVSTSFAAPGLPPAGLRNLLYNPQEEFHPYFSTCPHWRDGDLMPAVKCALSHIPKPLEGSGIDRLGKEVRARLSGPQSGIVSLCGNCRPIRRCPSCSTEYLIEIKMAEDRNETDPTKMFKQALVVTRWSDLGDGSTPTLSREWAAVSGSLDDFDSFAVIGRRAISGVFESQFNVDQIPPQRILNMNPNKENLGESGHNWY